eukprot:3878574-Prymnesium_polylepis.1
MASDDDDSVVAAVMRLALCVDQSEDAEQMAVLGTVLRDNCGLEALLSILRNPELVREGRTPRAHSQKDTPRRRARSEGHGTPPC